MHLTPEGVRSRATGSVCRVVGLYASTNDKNLTQSLNSTSTLAAPRPIVQVQNQPYGTNDLSIKSLLPKRRQQHPVLALITPHHCSLEDWQQSSIGQIGIAVP